MRASDVIWENASADRGTLFKIVAARALVKRVVRIGRSYFDPLHDPARFAKASFPCHPRDIISSMASLTDNAPSNELK
jgi:hypothetical protein